MEKAYHPFMLGVQWHPEGTPRADEPSQRLFRALVEAARDKRG
jgi:putative glutamine amidotransferase